MEGDWHSDDYFRILMPTRGGGNAGSSPLHYVDRKMRVFLPSLDVSYGSSPAGTFGQPASKVFYTSVEGNIVRMVRDNPARKTEAILMKELEDN